MEIQSLTPEEFLERAGATADQFKHLFERGNRYERQELQEKHEYLEADKEIEKLPLLFRGHIVTVYDRVRYGKCCLARLSDRSLPFIRYPLVDKKLNVVFDGGHGDVMGDLYNFHAGTDHRMLLLEPKSQILSMYGMPGLTSDEVDPAREYIVSGYGYMMSSVSGFINNGHEAFAISKKLFDSDTLDEYDEAIMKGRKIKLAEDFFV